MPRRLSLGAGVALGSVGTILGIVLLTLISGQLGYVESLALPMISWLLLLIMPHSLSHYVVGRLVGVRFSHYVLAPTAATKILPKSLARLARRLPLLGLRVDWKASQALSNTKLIAMFASGTIVSMLAPVAVVVKTYAEKLMEATALLGALTLANIAFTLIYSPKAGDLSRASRVQARAKAA